MVADERTEDSLNSCPVLGRIPRDALERVQPSDAHIEFAAPYLIDCTGEPFGDLSLTGHPDLLPSGGSASGDKQHRQTLHELPTGLALQLVPGVLQVDSLAGAGYSVQLPRR